MDKMPIEKLLDLSGKTAIVTGGVLGIGFGIASRLAQAGANVMIADLDISKLYPPDISKLYPPDAENVQMFKAIKCDISNEQEVRGLVSQTVEVFGGLDILVNNAGIYPNIPISQMTSDDFDKVLAVNLKGAFLCIKYVSRQMIRQGRGGKIINITSIDALHPSMVGLAHYDASKHGLWGLTKNAALELAAHKIWVNAIAPGAVDTPGTGGLEGGPALEAFLAKIPMHRMGDADDIGKVALFLASEMSSYMTGAQIVVDGGVLLS